VFSCEASSASAGAPPTLSTVTSAGDVKIDPAAPSKKKDEPSPAASDEVETPSDATVLGRDTSSASAGVLSAPVAPAFEDDVAKPTPIGSKKDEPSPAASKEVEKPAAASVFGCEAS